MQLSYRLSHIWLAGVLLYDTEVSWEWLPMGPTASLMGTTASRKCAKTQST